LSLVVRTGNADSRFGQGTVVRRAVGQRQWNRNAQAENEVSRGLSGRREIVKGAVVAQVGADPEIRRDSADDADSHVTECAVAGFRVREGPVSLVILMVVAQANRDIGVPTAPVHVNEPVQTAQ